MKRIACFECTFLVGGRRTNRASCKTRTLSLLKRRGALQLVPLESVLVFIN